MNYFNLNKATLDYSCYAYAMILFDIDCLKLNFQLLAVKSVLDISW